MVLKNYPLDSLNTFGLKAKAALYCEIDSAETLASLWKSNLFVMNKPLVLGGGSNLLFLKDYIGIVLKNNLRGREVLQEGEESVQIELGAGENWHQAVLWTLEQGWGGLENLSFIPGTVGAAPIQNIGAYGVELESVFESLTAFDMLYGTTVEFNKVQCAFGYRESIFKKTENKGRYFILSVRLRLNKHHQPKMDYGDIKAVLERKSISNPGIKEVSNAVIEIRQSKLPDPAVLGNSGSFFKNPVVSKTIAEKIRANYPEVKIFEVDEERVKIPAGWLIEASGWKGKRIGNVGMHEKQALVLVNYGNATGAELWEHAQKVIDDIENRFGIRLQPEVNVIG